MIRGILIASHLSYENQSSALWCGQLSQAIVLVAYATMLSCYFNVKEVGRNDVLLKEGGIFVKSDRQRSESVEALVSGVEFQRHSKLKRQPR